MSINENDRVVFCKDNINESGAALNSNFPSFQDLMDPQVMTKSQCGMEVESVWQQGETIRIVTTGMEMIVNTLEGKISFSQRIGHERPVASLQTGCMLQGTVVTHSTSGFARITFEHPKMTIRVNGDSLVMMHVHEKLNISIYREIPVAWSASFHANHLIADEWGGLAIYCSENNPDSWFNTRNTPMAEYQLQPDNVLCIGVCPPKPYNWDSSINDQVVWHHVGTRTEDYPGAYPPDELLPGWAYGGNIVLLQSEIALWKDWLLDFVPRWGEIEFTRVRDWLQKRGLKLIVYTSPYYFVRGTDQESLAFNDWADFVNLKWPVEGSNIEYFLEAIKRVMENLKPDGLYFDGQYFDNPAALYALARRSREIIGEKGILEWHSTCALGLEGYCYMPHADAYTDIQLRGEGQFGSYNSFDYMRFFVSGYNISNTTGVLCNNYSDTFVTPKQIDELLLANCRLHTFCGDAAEKNNGGLKITPAYVKYWSRLNKDLRAIVEGQTDKRQILLLNDNK